MKQSEIQIDSAIQLVSVDHVFAFGNLENFNRHIIGDCKFKLVSESDNLKVYEPTDKHKGDLVLLYLVNEGNLLYDTVFRL